jgi:hypothetical protein
MRDIWKGLAALGGVRRCGADVTNCIRHQRRPCEEVPDLAIKAHPTLVVDFDVGLRKP